MDVKYASIPKEVTGAIVHLDTLLVKMEEPVMVS